MAEHNDTPDPVITALGALQGDLTLVISHLVPFLKAQQGVGALQERIDRLERQRAARLERPLINGVAAALGHLRRADLDPAVAAAVEGELVRALTEAGCQEFDPLGEAFDPSRHNAVAAEAADRPVVTAVHRRGVESFGDIIIKASVNVGSSSLTSPPSVNEEHRNV